MKRLILTLLICSVSVTAYTYEDTDIWIDGHNYTDADQVRIIDAGSYYTDGFVEGALQELGDGTALDGRYLKLDCSNDPLTGGLDLGANSLTTTGTAFLGLIDLGTNTIDDLAMTGAWDMNSGAMTNVNIDTGDIATAVVNTEWDAAYTHSIDNSQAHTDYMLNTGDTSTGHYDFTAGNLTTTGNLDATHATMATISVRERATVATIQMATGSIKDTTGAISFDNENLTTTGIIQGEHLYTTDDLVVDDEATIKGAGFLLLEIGDYLLLESGDKIIREDAGTILLLQGGGISDSGGTISFVDEDLVTTGQISANNIAVGTISPSASFRGAGDIYATSGVKAMEGLYAEAVAYGAGLEISDNDLTVTYTNIDYGDATLTASTQTIEDTHASFDSDYVGLYFKVIGSTPSFTGATGEIIGVASSTEVVVSFGTAGGDTIPDATAMSFVIYPEPRCFIGDNGDVHYCIGEHEDASFKVCTDISNNEHAIHFVSKSGVAGNALLELEYDPDTYSDCSAIEVDYDATAFSDVGTIGTVLDVIIDNANGATAGDIHVMDVALSDTANVSLEVEAVATHEGVDVIGQYLGDPAALATAWEGDQSGGPSYTDRTAAFNAAGTDVAIFDDDNDFIILGSVPTFDEINVILDTTASHTILPTFHYSKAAAWEAFTPADDTDGFTNSATIRFDSDTLVAWEGQTIDEMTGQGDAIDDYYWIKITRTRNNLVRQPIEDTIQVTALGTKLGWNKEGSASCTTIAVVDGITIPGAVSGFAVIYVDTNDGDLKVKFGNNFVATIAADS